jgi:heme exporter protein CcmD
MELLSMGGYGAYVWTAYALTFGVLILCVAQGRRRHRRVFRELRTRLLIDRPAVERSK